MVQALQRAGFAGIQLPKGATLPGISAGRVAVDGYARGCGLEFGDVRNQVASHPLYRDALKLASGRSVMSADRLMNIFLLIGCYFEDLASQNIIEFGSYRGGSLMFFGKLLSVLYPGAHVYGYDTFQGMPKTDHTMDLHNEGDFADTSVAQVEAAITKSGLKNITLNAGLVEDTFPARSPPGITYGLAHIDLDIYHPIRHIQKSAPPFMTKGGYIVYDDATASSCIGATQAVEDWIQETGARSEQIFPHFVFRAGLG